MRAWLVLAPLFLFGCPDDEGVDADLDGYFDDEDCDDADRERHPGRTEVCNGIDDDCDNVIDDEAQGAFEWFKDEDNDSFGARSTSLFACARPPGYAPNRNDCNDRNAEINPNALEICNEQDDDCDGESDEGLDNSTLWYLDRDGDGFGGGNAVGEGCASDPSWTKTGGDCNDIATAQNPGAPELCDGVDNDCDGKTDDADDSTVGQGTFYADADGDTYGWPLTTALACKAPTGFTDNALDCDDANAALSPATLWNRDADVDGFGDEADQWPSAQCWRPIGYINNALDCNDADADQNSTRSWFEDLDLDTFGGAFVVTGCIGPDDPYVPDAGDCDDLDFEIKPGQPELCDERDNDCDNATDDADPDAVGDTTFWRDSDGDGFGDALNPSLACNVPANHADNADDCNDRDARVHPGTRWFRDADRDGLGDPHKAWPELQCEAPAGTVYVAGDCDDRNPQVNDDSLWWTDADGDGIGLFTPIPAAFGCPDDRTGLVLLPGDCDDNNPDVVETSCLGPKFGLLHFELQFDGFATETAFSISCDGVEIAAEGPFARSSNNKRITRDYEVETGAVCEVFVTDSWGDGGPSGLTSMCGSSASSYVVNGRGGRVATWEIGGCSGCMDPNASNFDPTALVDDGICIP